MEPADILAVQTTVETREQAQQMVRAAVEARLAACGQIIGPIASTYWWQGAVEDAEEWLCVFKTTGEAYPGLERAIRQRHTYDVAEIVALPIIEGSADYLAWCAREVGARSAP